MNKIYNHVTLQTFYSMMLNMLWSKLFRGYVVILLLVAIVWLALFLRYLGNSPLLSTKTTNAMSMAFQKLLELLSTITYLYCNYSIGFTLVNYQTIFTVIYFSYLFVKHHISQTCITQYPLN